MRRFQSASPRRGAHDVAQTTSDAVGTRADGPATSTPRRRRGDAEHPTDRPVRCRLPSPGRSARCRQRGVTAIEYALIAALIAVASVAAVTRVGTTLSDFYGGVATQVSGANGG